MAATYVNPNENVWKTKCMNITDEFIHDACVTKYKKLAHDADMLGVYIVLAIFGPLLAGLLVWFVTCGCLFTPAPPQRHPPAPPQPQPFTTQG